MIRNFLILKNNFLQLEGFEKIKSNATFSFYDNGIAITGKSIPHNELHYDIYIDNKRRIYEKNIFKIIKQKNTNKIVWEFIESNETYISLIK